MKPYVLEKDKGLALQRKGGKNAWKARAVAKLAPEMLEGCNEDTVRELMIGEIEAEGLAYVTFEDSIYSWLLAQAGKHWQARLLLSTIKDFPDLLVFRKVEGERFTRALSLELKRQKKNNGGSKGQRQLAAAIGGQITQGYGKAHIALQEFVGKSEYVFGIKTEVTHGKA